MPVSRSQRYAYIRLDGRKQLAHRIMYRELRGPIPEGTELDHLCRNTACVNPAHLDPVPHRENMRRSPFSNIEKCARGGHPYTPENTYRRPDGWKECRTCRAERRKPKRRVPVVR